MEAVEAVAYYQPRFALDFAKRLIKEGHGSESSVCNMVRNAAYTHNNVQEACQLLWTAGRNDRRQLNQQPSHGIRLLKELASFQLNKLIEYVREVVRYALELLERPASLKSSYTPFTILEGALRTEMESTSYSRSTMTITRYKLPLSRVQSVRDEVTNALLKYLREGPARRAFLAAQTFGLALRGPMHGDGPGDAWKLEHVKLLQALRSALSGAQVSAVVLVRLAQSVSWHAFRGWPETSVEAQAVMDLLDRDLRTRLTRALIDGWGTETWKLGDSLEREEHTQHRQALTAELIAAFSKPGQLLDELQSTLEEISEVSDAGYSSSHLLISHLLATAPGLASELLVRDSEGRAGALEPYVGAALTAIVEAGDSKLLNDYMTRSEASAKVLTQLAQAYARYEPSRSYTPSEVELFKRIFKSKDPTVLMVASHLTRQMADRSPALAIELICLADFEANPEAADDMFMWLSGDKTIPEAEVATKRGELLKKLVALRELDDYWVRSFLTTSMEKDPTSVVELVAARIWEASRRNDWSYHPLRKEHEGKGLGLMDTEDGPALLRGLLDQALKDWTDVQDIRHVGEAVAGLCGPYNEPMVNLLLGWMSSATRTHATLVARVLQESQPTLIYEHPKFVRDILNEAELLGDDALEEIRSSIGIAASSGMRGGTAGEPFPEDVKMEQHCEQMLATLSRAEPAFDLYDALLKDARYAIARQRKSKEAMEEEDE
ncbi:hypothetical protein [Roseateles sp.]|uniref:hypothetical protein n=1 Tax=Roseateles sp. TaxID=1971397 RepID=UPI0025F88A18|nr:hypothetical protein [Roseateles sp.]MBV8037651.1 hypothetical protein [Roseateles sp.]